MTQEIKIPVCPKCGSHEVFQAASAVWDPFLRQWALAVLHGDMFCGECDHEFTANQAWKNITAQ